ncbi:MAG: T9SS type A sorting domain-containing protein [bacterium]
MVRRSFWMVALLIMAFAAVSQAQVVPDSAVYDEATNVLSIYFSGTVRTTASMVPVGQLVLDDDNGGIRDDYTLLGGTVMNTASTGAVVQIRLYFGNLISSATYTDVNGEDQTYDIWGNDISALLEIENVLSHSSLSLIVPTGVFVTPTNQAVTGATVPVSYVVDTSPVTFVSAQYNADTNILKFTFSDKIQFDEVAEDKARNDANGWPAPGDSVLNVLPPEDLNGNGVLDFEKNLVKASIDLTVGGESFQPSSSIIASLRDTTVIDVLLTYAEQQIFENMNLASGITVTFPVNTFLDQDYNSVVPVADMAVTYVPDATPLQMTAATYDMGTNQLVATFNATLGANAATLSRASRFTFELIDASSNILDSYTLEIAQQIARANGNLALSVLLLPSDAMHVEDMIDSLDLEVGESIQISAEPFVTLDEAGNGNVAGIQPVTIGPETATLKAPELSTTDVVEYDAATNTLTVPFDLSLDAAIDSANFTLVAGDVSISLADAHPSRALSNKGVALELTDETALEVESVTDKDGITLTVDPYAVLQSRFKNGNRLIEDAPVTYVAATMAPLLQTIFYDTENGLLIIESSNAEFEPSTQIDLTQLTLSGVQLAAPDSAHSLSPTEAVFYLSASVVASLNALSADDMMEPSAVMGAGLLTNSDSLASLATTGAVMNGDVLTNGTETATLSLGFGRQFSIRSYEAFPTPARTIYAFLKAESDNAYWYVDNVALSDGLFDSTSLANVIKFFQDSTPYDTLMGARDVLMDIYAPNKASLVPDMVSFVVTDVLDEFGLGRNDSKATLWKSGYIVPDDDLIYLDCDPTTFGTSAVTSAGLRHVAQLFSEYLSYKLDSFEELWLRKGLAFFSEFLIGSRDVDVAGFTEPTFGGGGAATGFSGANDLTFIGGDLRDRLDYKHAYMFLLYLYEKYGAEEIITQISESRRIGINSIQTVLNLMWEQGAFDDTAGRKTDVEDLYLDFATAILLDMRLATDDPGNGLYEFHNLNNGFTVAPGIALLWSPSQKPPYSFTGTNWGFMFIKTAYNPGGGVTLPLISSTDSLAINVGEDGATMRFRKLNFTVDEFGFGARTVYDVQELDAKDGSELVPISHGVDWTFGPATNPDAEVRMTIFVAVNAGDFLLTNDIEAADYVNLFVAQNSLYSRKFEVYVLADRQLYSAPGIEAPILTVTMDSDTVATFSNAEDYVLGQNTGTAYQYFTSTWLSESGSYTWYLSGTFANGRSISAVGSVPVTVTSVGNGESKLIAIDEEFQMQISGRSFDHEQYMTVVANYMGPDQVDRGSLMTSSKVDRIQVSQMFSIAAEQKDLSDPAMLTLAFDKEVAGDRDLGIYYNYKGQWVYVGGSVNRESGTVSTRIGKLGDYRVMAGRLGETPAELALPTEFALKQNYPNPFNPSTTIEIVLPNASNVHLVIFDILGREVVRLVDSPLRFGSHKVVWDGRNAYGQPLSSGVYFVQMRADDFSGVRKMVLVK